MTDQQILEKAIQKAIDGGFMGYWAERYEVCKQLGEMEYLVEGNNVEDGKTVETLIFNHDFAKALWGDGNGGGYYKLNDPKRTPRKLWEHMLQQMVIAEDPLAYLGEHL